MADTILHFIKPGLFTSLQDNGREGLQEYGIPVGGAADRDSYHLANELVGNSLNSPCLEITLIGPEIKIETLEEISAAVSGARLSMKINGSPAPHSESFILKNDDVLTFGAWQRGCRSYLSIKGKWQVPSWQGSVSPILGFPALTPSGIIKKGDRLEISAETVESQRKIETQGIDHSKPLILPLLKGPEFYLLEENDIQVISARPFRITSDSNRMGYRLDFEGDIALPAIEMISSGILPGTIQMTTSGQPIILLYDAQTTGGYPRIGIIPEEFLGKLAQCRPGDSIQFSWQ